VVGRHQIDAACLRTSDVGGHTAQHVSTLLGFELAQILDDDQFAGAQRDPLDLRASIPFGRRTTKGRPDLAAVVGFSVAGRPGQDFGAGLIGSEIGENGLQELGGKHQRLDLQPFDGTLDGLVIHVVVGGDRAVVPKELYPTTLRRNRHPTALARFSAVQDAGGPGGTIDVWSPGGYPKSIHFKD
jgi:hypothetical protein